MSKKTLTYNGNYEETASDTPSTALPYSSFDSHFNNSPQTSNSHDTDSISDNSKKIRKKRCTYQKIEDDARIKLIEAVKEGETLKAAAKRYNINYSSAKSILHTYRTEGRIFKKSAQERVARKRTKDSSNLEMSPIYPYNTSEDNFTGIPELSTYQTYHSPEPESPKAYNFVSKDLQNNGVRDYKMTAFRDILSTDLQSQQSNPPSNTVVFKLESHGLQKVPSNNIRTVPARNWQLNLNVQKENFTETNPIPTEGTYLRQINPSQNQEKGSYVDHSTNPMPYVSQTRREEPHFDRYYTQGYNSFSGMMNYPEENDISCFLNSNPVYERPHERSQEPENVGMSGNHLALNNSRRVSESYNHYYDESNRVHTMENYRL